MRTASSSGAGRLGALIWTACGLSGWFLPVAAVAEPASRAYALVLPETVSAEGHLAVAYVKSPADAKIELPLLMVDDFDSGEIPDTGDFVEQNVVIALPKGVRLHTLHDLPEHVFPYFPGLNHANLEAFWGPEQGGRRFGLLCYHQKWGTAAVVAMDLGTAVESGEQLDVVEMLDAAVEKGLEKTLKNPEDAAHYVISYSTISVDDPSGALGIGAAVSFHLALNIEVPKADDEPTYEGSATLTLKRGAKGTMEAKVSDVVVTKAG